MKNKDDKLPESLAAWNARLTAYSTPEPKIPPQPTPKLDNEQKLRKQIEAQAPFLRLEYILHERGCVAPCRCRVRAHVTRFARYGHPTTHLVCFREPS